MDYFQDILKKSLEKYNINVDHEYLDISEEARLEHLSYISNDKNDEIIKNMLKNLNIINDNNNEDIIIVSVGTSSTQLCNKTKVLGYLYIGSDAIFHENILALSLLNKIKSIIDNNNISITTPIIFINSISKIITKTINLSKSLSNDELITYLDNKEYLDLLIKLSELSKSITNPIIISIDNIDNSWSNVKLNELYGIYKNVTTYLYFIDFGGGGINLKIHNYDTNITTSIAKYRVLLTYGQEKFINEILNKTIKETSMFESIIEFIQNNIITYSLQNNININNDDKYYLKIIQTGKSRQFAYIQSIEPII
jgi:hypothetical protein